MFLFNLRTKVVDSFVRCNTTIVVNVQYVFKRSQKTAVSYTYIRHDGFGLKHLLKRLWVVVFVLHPLFGYWVIETKFEAV